MVDLPVDGEGLSWIASHDPDRLQLIPGLQPASVAAAAAGDQQALAYLRFTAQHHAAYPSGSAMNELDRALLQASDISSNGADDALSKIFQGLGQHAPRYEVFRAREQHTMEQFAEAVRQGELAAYMWMRAICIKTWSTLTQEIMPIAAEAGQLSILQYLRSGPAPEFWDSDTTTAALPHLNCLKWLLSTDAPGGSCEYRGGILCDIAEHHGLPGVQWFCERCEDMHSFDTGAILVTAVELNDRPMLQWLRAQNPPPPWTVAVCSAAVEFQNLIMLSWLRSQEPPCLWDELVTAAAASRDLKILQWLRAQEPPCPWGPSTWAAAAGSGKLEVLTWLRDQDPPCPWDATCAEAAASRQSLETLLWLLHNGRLCEPWCTKSSVIAACRGDLPMLEWLSDNGTPLTGDLYIAAAKQNHSHILRYLISRNTALPEAPSGPISCFYTSTPMKMFLSDIKMPLHREDRQHVNQARSACCLFHGLIRWFKRAVSDPSRRAHLAFDSLAKDRSGQLLLMRLSRLPPELISKIAVAAKLQHDVPHPSLRLA